MGEAGNSVILLNKEELPELRARLNKRKSPEIIIIDSVQYLDGFNWASFKKLKREYPDKLFIFISQADRAGKDPDGKLAGKIRYDAEIKSRLRASRHLLRHATRTQSGARAARTS